MDGQQNGTATAPSCSGRSNSNSKGHCYHLAQPAYRTPTGAAMFTSTCCWCAPDWMHTQIFVPSQVSDEDVAAQAVLHGPRITVQRAPKQGPRLHIPGM